MRAIANLVAAGLCALGAVARPVQEADVATRSAAINKTAIDPTLYDQIVHYAPYPEAAGVLANGPCNTPPHGSVLVQYFDINATDTQAALFRDDAAKEFILGIPGTADLFDFVTDFTFVPVPYLAPNVECSGCLAHLGFLSAWDSLASPVNQSLKTNLAKYPGYTVVISGHSLGGAIAQLAYGSLLPIFPVTDGYTYGQPRVGNPAFADYIDKLSGASDTNVGTFRRVTHYNDGVPQVPSQSMGFRHSRTELFESTMAPAENTSYRCYGQEPADCNDAIGSGFINAAHTSYAGLQYNCT